MYNKDAETHEYGPFWWKKIRLTTDAPRYHEAPTRNPHYPYQVCERSVVLRIAGHFGIVIGWWAPSHLEEDEAIRRAVRCDLENSLPTIWGDIHNYPDLLPAGADSPAEPVG